ncbi:MAG: 4'-phosphopantetheinyl transferase superfamily protein [Pseudobdellovibrio sp.]
MHKTPSNKPYLSHSSLYVSYSDKDDLKIQALSPYPLGVDIESFASLKTNWSVFFNRFFTTHDKETADLLITKYSLESNLSYLMLFSAKEAYLKLVDLKRDPLQFYLELESIDINKKYLHLKSHDLISKSNVYIFWSLKQLPSFTGVDLSLISKNLTSPDILSIATF